MAINLRTAGTIAVVNATTQVVTLPATTAGDMMVIFFACKPYTATPTIDNGWTSVGTPYNNGTTGSGNGTGSNLVGAFWKVAVGSDANPTITWGTTVTPGAAVCVTYSKTVGGDVWAVPAGVGGGITTAATNYANVADSSHLALINLDWAVGILASRDDTAFSTVSSTQTGSFTGTNTADWTGGTTATSDDMSYTALRSVSTGTSSAAATTQATLAATETAAHYRVRVRAEAANPQNPQPASVALVLTMSTPAVVIGTVSQPTALALTTAYGTPTVTVGANVTASPAQVDLVLTMSTPAVAAPRTALPDAVALTLTMSTPAVVIGTVSQPTALALTTTLATPAVLAPRLVSPAALALVTTYGTPAVVTPVLVSPSALALVTAFSTPTVTAGSGVDVVVLPDALALVTAFDTPTVTVAAVPVPAAPGGMQQAGHTKTLTPEERAKNRQASLTRNALAAEHMAQTHRARKQLGAALRALHGVP